MKNAGTKLLEQPFLIRALQVDGGSEFAVEFEQACRQRGWHLFVLPRRSLNSMASVERANRTHTEEFYQVSACWLEMKKLNRQQRPWASGNRDLQVLHCCTESCRMRSALKTQN